MGHELIDWVKSVDWENYIDSSEVKELLRDLQEKIGDNEDGEDSPRIKLVVVGDGAVGKTCLLVTYATNDFPEEYVPTVFDNRTTEVVYKGQNLLLQLWDTAGQEDYDRLRPLSYPGSDIVLLCFSTVSRSSYDAVVDKWSPEVNHYAPGVPQLLVGTKMDMREAKIKDSHEDSFDPITKEEGKELAEDIGAVGYVECSAKTRSGLKQIFEEAIRIVMESRASGNTEKEKKKSSSSSKKKSSSKSSSSKKSKK